VRRIIPSPLILSIWLALLSSLSAQTGNPAVAEDAEMERRKILKAADQVDRVDQQVDQIQSRVTALEQLLADLRQQSQSLKESLANAAAKSSQERTALLEEVSKMLAERKEREKAKATEKAAAVTKPVEKEGYEHTVAKGDTLSSIAQAYNSEYQLKLTSETIRQANQLAKNAPLKVGQKLIVPSK
jgi:LysM repeat protein